MNVQEKRIPLLEGSNLSLVDYNNGNKFDITVKEQLGLGSNCIVYDVEFNGSTRGVLKECWPAKFENDLCRDENLELTLVDKKSKSLKQDFAQSLEKFKSDYQKILDFRKKSKDNWNYISQPIALLCTQSLQKGKFGTLYSLYSIDNGDSLSKNSPKSAHEVFGILLSAARGLKIFHDNNQVYLDFKADNLFVFPEESNHQVKFFDQDASADLEDLHTNKNFRFFSTMDWEAPEMKKVRKAIEEGEDDLKDRQKIGKHTDFYLVGLLADKLLGTKYKDSIDYAVKWEYNHKNVMFHDVTPEIRQPLLSFFEQTLNVAQNKRYKTDDKLIKALVNLFNLSVPKQRYIIPNVPSANKAFVGRETELAQMKKILDESNNATVFLCGSGGLGKTDTAKKYIDKHKDEFDIIVKVDYKQGLEKDIFHQVKIANFDARVLVEDSDNEDSADKEKKAFEKFFDELRILANSRVLLFIDNFDINKQKTAPKTTEMNNKQILTDPYLEDIMSLECKKIFTTRQDFANKNKYKDFAVKITPDENTSNLKQIFYDNGSEAYKLCNEQTLEIDKKVEELIVNILHRHTLAIKILATQLRELRIESIDVALDGLREHGLNWDSELFEYDDEDASGFGHIAAIYDISKIKDDEKEWLEVLTFIPPSGIHADTLRAKCGFEGTKGNRSLNTLRNNNWIQEDSETNVVSLHPVISEVLWHKLKPKLEEGLLGKYALNFYEDLKEERLFPRYSSISDSLVYDKDEYFKNHDLFFANRVWQETAVAALLFFEIAKNHFMANDYLQAEIFAEKALKIFERISSEQISDVEGCRRLLSLADYCNMLSKHYCLGSYKKAVKYGVLALKLEMQRPSYEYRVTLEKAMRKLLISENLDSEAIKTLPKYPCFAYIYEAQSDLCNKLGQFDKALDFGLLSFETYMTECKDSNSRLLTETYLAISNAYNGLQEYRKSLEYLLKAEESIKMEESKSWIYDAANPRQINRLSMDAHIYYKIGSIYSLLKENSNAITYLELAESSLLDDMYEYSDGITSTNVVARLIKVYQQLVKLYKTQAQHCHSKECVEKLALLKSNPVVTLCLKLSNYKIVTQCLSPKVSERGKKTLQKDVSTILTIYDDLAKKYNKMDAFYGTVDCLSSALRICEHIETLNVTDVIAACYEDIAYKYLDVKCFDKARNFAMLALEINHPELTENERASKLSYFFTQQPLSQTKRNVLKAELVHCRIAADKHFKLKEYDTAYGLEWDVLDLRRKLWDVLNKKEYDMGNKYIAMSYKNLALLSKLTERYEEAKRWGNKWSGLQSYSFHENFRLRKYDVALEITQETVTFWEKVLCEDSWHLPKFYIYSSMIYDALDLHGKALQYELDAAQILEQMIFTQSYPESEEKEMSELLMETYTRLEVRYKEMGQTDKSRQFGLLVSKMSRK